MRRPRLLAKVAVASRAARAVAVARWVLRHGGLPAALRHYGLEPCDVVEGTARTTAALTRSDAPAIRTAMRTVKLPGIGSSCLPTSLALADVLRSRGYVPDVVIGVASKGGEFSAHAWIEIGGDRLDASRLPLDSYREIGRFRPSRKLAS